MSNPAADTDAPRPGRIGPREAAQLAAGVRAAGITRGSARVILELLLRHTRGTLAVERSIRWIAREAGGIHYDTAKRALHVLIDAELIEVAVRGDGRTVSAYRVDVARLRGLAEDSPAVHPADILAPPGGAERTPRGGRTHPQGVQNAPPGGAERTPRPRVYARAPGSLLPLYSLNPPPPELEPPEPADDSPAASRGDPLSGEMTPDEKCRHGRTVAQGGCRDCGTTRRVTAKRDQVDGQAAQRSRALERRRTAEVEARALSVRPAPGWRSKK